MTTIDPEDDARDFALDYREPEPPPTEEEIERAEAEEDADRLAVLGYYDDPDERDD